MPRYIIRYDRCHGWHIWDRYELHAKKEWFDNEWMAMYWAINNGGMSIFDVEIGYMREA